MPILTKNDTGYTDYNQPSQLTDQPKKFNEDFISEEEALRYAAARGADDSIRGIQQIYGQITNNEQLLEKLQEKDTKLKAIFDNPQYGSKALAAYMGTTMFLDPVGWVPILGWGRKAKSIQKGVNYGMSLGQSVRKGALGGAAWSGVGYYGEDDPTRAEGVLAGAAFGGTLAYGASKVANIYRKATGKSPAIPNSAQKQQMAGEDLVQQAKQGNLLSPEETKKAQDLVVEELMKERESSLSKSVSGLNLRKNYENIVGEKVWDVMVNNWGSGLVGVAAASGGYSALDDPEASELQKFGAALAMGLGGVLGVKGLKRIPINDTDNLGQIISKGFIDNYGLDDAYVKLKKGTLAEVNSLRSQFVDIVRATDAGLTDEEQKVFYAMLHGVMDDLPELKPLKDSTRQLIRNTGEELVRVGLLDPKVFRKNAETYLHRSYDKKMSGQAAGPEFIKAARQFKIIGDELRPRGPKPINITRKHYLKNVEKYRTQGFDVYDVDNLPEEAKIFDYLTPKQYDKKSKAYKKRYVEVGTTDDGKLILEDTNKIRLKRDYTKEERETMGEIENASFAIAETGRLMTNDLAAYKLFQNISESEFAVDAATFANKVDEGELIEDAWVQIPKSTKFKNKAHEVFEYGKLAGHYVPKEVYDDLSKLIPTTKDDFTKLLGDKYLGIMRFWKKSKTAWNPTVHVNNTMSNVMMYDNANGQYKYLKRGYEELRKGLDGRMDATIYKMAREDGVLDVDILSRELNKETNNALGKAINDLVVEGRDELTNSMNYSKKLVSGSKKLYNATFKKMEDWYQAEDQVFRMALYMDRLAKGYSRTDAAGDAKKWFIDYDINAPAINFLKNTATPFISYSYRVVPLLAETAAKKPWKFAKWAALGYTLNELGQAYGTGDEEVERMVMPDRLKERMYGLPFMPRTTIKTPFTAGRDETAPLYVDVTRFIPGGDVFSMGEKGIPLPIPVPFSKSITGETKYLTSPGALQPNFGIAGEVLAPMMYGIDPFTQEKIKGLGLGNDAKVKMQHVLSRLLPNVPAPYILPEKFESYSSRKIREAFQSREYSGKKAYASDYSPFEAIMSSFGFKLEPVQFTKLLGLEDAQLKRMYNTVRAQAYRLYREYEQNKSPEKKEEIEKQLNELYATLENAERIARAKREQVRERTQKKFGGVAIDPNYPVSDVTENPAERENPYTGEPYLREGFAWGGEMDVFTPLAKEVEKLAMMESVEGASALTQGVMPMEELEREQKQAGGPAYVTYGQGSLFNVGAKLLGVTQEQIESNFTDAAKIVNKAVDKGLVHPQERIIENEDGSYNFSKTGDAFNAVNHGLLSYRLGDKMSRRIALQVKEGIQGAQAPLESMLDRLNNKAGFDIRNSVENAEQAEELIYKKIEERTRKLKNKIPLESGKDFFFTPEEARHLYPLENL